MNQRESLSDSSKPLEFEITARIIVQAETIEQAVRLVESTLASEPEFENSWVSYVDVRNANAV